MKRNVITTVILAVAAMLAVGCTPENVAPEPQPNETTRNVSYVKCGEPGHATVTGVEAWHALLNTLFDAVDEGCEVSFWETADGEGQATKESVTYRTASRDSAYAWGESMYDSGYVVSVIFDPDEHVYVCSAVKTIPMPDYRSFYSSLYGVVGPEELLVINSQVEFDTLFPNCAMPIYLDFNTQSLLAVYGTSLQTVTSTAANVSFDGNEVTVTITVELGDGDCPTGWTKVFACSPKIIDGMNVSLIVNYL